MIGVVSPLFLIFLILGILWWKGCLLEAVSTVFPEAPHAFCMFHLKLNIQSKYPKKMGSGYGEVVANLFQKCCYAPSQLVFDQEMKTLIKDGGTIIQKFLQNIPKENWSNAYFRGKKYGEMCSIGILQGENMYQRN